MYISSYNSPDIFIPKSDLVWESLRFFGESEVKKICNLSATFDYKRERKNKTTKEMENSKFVAFAVAIIFGVTLIVSGLPLENIENIETTTPVDTDSEETTSNGTHKEL